MARMNNYRRCLCVIVELCGAAVVHNSFQTVGLSARDHERKQNDCTDSGADLCAHAPDLGSGLLRSILLVSFKNLPRL